MEINLADSRPSVMTTIYMCGHEKRTKIFPRAIVLIVMINVRVGNVLCDVHPNIFILGCTSAHAQREVLEREHRLG